MAKSASFLQYMRAHGNTPGPTQRPVLAGAATGTIAEIPALLMLWWSGALSSATQSLSVSIYATVAFYLLVMIIAGVIYGRVFSRAANDPRGGWLFGISFGFLIWMIGPVTVLQWWLDGPLALGVAAMGILGAHLIYGLFLGLLFPWIHRLLQSEISQLKGPGRHGTFGVKPQNAIQSRGK
ncbi:MAG TPA: hypothetical protein VKB02_08305 [Pyrinomonadaceae bacterium]|nr:hypothetical protein [Pyrinomonadaceae bacterium]